MDILDIIDKKEKGEKLTKEELQYVIDGYLNGTIKDYQMSALLTEIDLLGLKEEETINLTDIMLHSGEILDLGFDNIVDKHSTGGVGDKTTIVLAPLVASLGVKVAKMSGRGLGHTGGTIDKLESIKGFKTSMSLDEFKNQVDKIGIALVGQMGNLVPADKKIYALRDVTGTVDSIPLIASSIMSKKLASGASGIVIDLKVGSGALVNNLDEAKELANLMVKIGKNNNKKTACVLTNMDEPLGYAVGNSIEVIEAINTLKGDGPKDLTDLVIKLGSLMVSMGLNISEEEAEEKVKENLYNGKGYEKMLEWVKAQGGDINNIPLAKHSKEIITPTDGYISFINALEIGKLSRKLGAGRLTKDDEIDLTVGIILNHKVGEYVQKDETLATVFYNEKEVTDEEILSCFKFSENPVEEPKLIIDIIR
ncbi:pyrimidine-nucleoside phosphorylase [Firmicutes bacterium CAG:822]|nr:pyrimidine-nucleoside phosphorylase [Firmicutes bacterium CAG:822]